MMNSWGQFGGLMLLRTKAATSGRSLDPGLETVLEK
jgi:hypothetical protein